MEPKASNSRGALQVAARGGFSCLSESHITSHYIRPAHKTSRVEGRHREEVEDDEEGHLIYKPGDTLQGRYVARKLVPCRSVTEKYWLKRYILLKFLRAFMVLEFLL